MVKLLSTLILILAIILFPPSVLAVISNNAVPGDSTYPIKRTLENGIYAIVSLNPTTKAWFSAARSDRRFKEVTVLLAQGKVATETLDELVSQTEVAADEIKKISDPVKKQELINQLTQQIEKYDQGLPQASKKTPSATNPAPTPQSVSSTPQSTFTPTPRPHVSVSPQATPTPTTTPRPAQSPGVSPAFTPTPPALPSVPPSPVPSDNDVDDARDKLDKIKEDLENALESEDERDRNQNSNNRENSGRGNENRDRNNNSNSGRNRD